MPARKLSARAITFGVAVRPQTSLSRPSPVGILAVATVNTPVERCARPVQSTRPELGTVVSRLFYLNLAEQIPV